jgi:hypothetical protein
MDYVWIKSMKLQLSPSSKLVDGVGIYRQKLSCVSRPAPMIVRIAEQAGKLCRIALFGIQLIALIRRLVVIYVLKMLGTG